MVNGQMSHDPLANTPRLAVSGDGAAIEYRDGNGELIWSTPVQAVVVMAEYTNPYGPHLDDYFLVFIFNEQGQGYIREASFYSAGRDELLSELSKRWNDDLRLGLCNSTDWKSRVIWPPQFASREDFTFTEVPPRSFLDRLRRFCFGPTLEYSPSAAVMRHVEAVCRATPTPE